MNNAKWINRSPMHDARSHFAIASYEGRIYVFGGGGTGFASLNSTEIYNPETDTWTRGEDMPTVRSGTAAAVINKKIHVVGGGLKLPDGKFQFFNTVEIYDPENDSWTNGPDMLMPHDYPACAVYKNQIYVMGGHHPDATGGGPMTDPGFSFCEVFSPDASKWSKLAPMPTPRFAHAAAVIKDKIMVMGGAGLREEGFTNYDIIEIFDPDSNKWDKAGIRLPWQAAGSGVLAYNNMLIIMGGKSDNRIENRTACLDTRTNVWKELEPLKEGRIVMGVASIGNTIYVTGGRGPDGKTPLAGVSSLALS